MPPIFKGKRTGIFLPLMMLLFLTMAYLAWNARRASSVVLPEGNRLVLTQVAVGKLNTFKHGTPLEKFAGKLIPSKGLRLLKWNFTPPTVVTNGGGEVPELSMEFRLEGTRETLSRSIFLNPPFHPIFLNPPFHPNIRMIHWGDDGFQYVTESFSIQKYSDGTFVYGTCSVFSRRSHLIHVQFQEHQQEEGSWKPIADFTFRNPSKMRDHLWPIDPGASTQSNSLLTVKLGQIQVKTNKTPSNDYWRHTVEVPFQFFQRGRPVTNWAAHEIYVMDSTGNKLILGASKTISNNIVTYSGLRSPDPFATWRLGAHFARDSDFDPTNLFKVQVPIPLPSVISTNLGDVPLTIDIVNGMMRVNMSTNLANLRLLFLDAQNQSGDSVLRIHGLFTGSSGQHAFFWRSIDLEKASPSISVSVALVDDFQFEFTAKPQVLE
jgi:hypothetical protein